MTLTLPGRTITKDSEEPANYIAASFLLPTDGCLVMDVSILLQLIPKTSRLFSFVILSYTYDCTTILAASQCSNLFVGKAAVA
jgi:hypothetical protein